MKKWRNIFLAGVLVCLLIMPETAKAAFSQRDDIVRMDYNGFGAWWKNRASGLVEDGTMMFYETKDGQTAYCLSNKKGHPNGEAYELSDGAGMEESFGKEEKEALIRIMRAGYPISRHYWAKRGLTELDMRGATQIALWYVQAQMGTDEHTGGSWKNGTWGNLGNRDVKSMIDALVEYGLSGGDSPVSCSIEIEPGEIIKSEEGMLCTFRAFVEGYGSWKGSLDGLSPDSIVTVNGKDSILVNGSFTSGESGKIEIAVRIPEGYERKLSCTVIGMEENFSQSLFYYRPVSGVTQDMAVFKMNVWEEGKRAKASLETPPQEGGKLKIVKKDKDNGDAILEENCVYGIFKDKEAKDQVSSVSIKDGIGISENLPFGTYYLKELAPPFGYALSQKIKEVILQKDDSHQQYALAEIHMEDEKQKGRIRIYKKDGDTGKFIHSPAVFSIIRMETGQEVEQITTGEDGIALSGPLELCDTYGVKEIAAPEGYQPLNGVLAELTLNRNDNGDKELFYDCSIANKAKTGGLIVQKMGTDIADFQMEDNHTEIRYKEVPLEGIHYEIFAEEDICFPDGPGTVAWRAGSRITDMVTDEKGMGRFDGLLPGKYILREMEGKDGYLKSEEELHVQIKAEEENEWEGAEIVNIVNKRQTAFIELQKKSAVDETSLSGAVFGLYTKEAIKAENGTVLEAGTLLQIAVTKEDGSAAFSEGVPSGFQYYVKEIKAPEGFLLSQEERLISIPASQEKQEQISLLFYNMPEKETKTTAVNSGERRSTLIMAGAACMGLASAWIFGFLRKRY